ncbi:hypothetical protein Sjap_011293 [Stephania japonica]|uniref:Uncharacterized protein n=1 Tax=Stephania japonica TaxID=461633 RepID=A0AAP0JB42_9MAGN
MPGSQKSAGDALESLSGTGLLLVSVCLEGIMWSRTSWDNEGASCKGNWPPLVLCVLGTGFERCCDASRFQAVLVLRHCPGRSWFHCSLSSSSSLSPNLCYLISNPTFLSFAPQRLPSRSSWLRRDWRRFNFRICASSSSATVDKPGGIKITSVPTKPIKGKKTRTSGIHKKVKVFKEENYLANWIKVRDFLVCLITALFRFALGEMTVRETLAFSARVQGVGVGHAKLLLELSRREKEANIKPDPDLDLFMKSMKILEVGKRSLMLSSSLTVAVAINGSRKSNCALKWALERFSDEGKVMFKLLHVRARITTIPTSMGNYITISQVRDDVATAYKKEMEWKTSKRLLPHKQLCRSKKGKLHQSKNIDMALELCFQSGDSGATHLALLILPTGHAIRSSVSALLCDACSSARRTALAS